MHCSRRQFVVLCSVAACGCHGGIGGDGNSPTARHDVDAGPLQQYEADGAYPGYRDRGCFIVRQAGSLFAVSSVCTHRVCMLDAKAGTFSCKCHGSTFDARGRVTRGPARRDLPTYATSVDARQHLIVHVGVDVPPSAAVAAAAAANVAPQARSGVQRSSGHALSDPGSSF